MENASKALLIAAGLLIVIVLVALGMKVFNAGQTEDIAGQAGQSIDLLQGTVGITIVTNFNKQIEKYMGNEKSFDQMMNMLKQIRIINTQNSTKIDVTWNTKDNVQTVDYYIDYSNRHKDDSKNLGNRVFNIDALYNEETGYIYRIYIDPI